MAGLLQDVDNLFQHGFGGHSANVKMVLNQSCLENQIRNDRLLIIYAHRNNPIEIE